MRYKASTDLYLQMDHIWITGSPGTHVGSLVLSRIEHCQTLVLMSDVWGPARATILVWLFASTLQLIQQKI